MRILIVDDISFVRKSLKQILTSLGHEVIAEATNGWEATELYEQHRPDLVTMDLAMPIMNGVDATKRIIEIDAHANILILSALSQEYLATEAILAGAKEYILKPFQTQEVNRAIHQMFNSNQEGKQSYA
jgi:two-component system chemotaxis response regulator CheY